MLALIFSVYLVSSANATDPLDLLREHFAATGRTRVELKNRLLATRPGGPVFLDETLKLILERDPKRKYANEYLYEALEIVGEALSNSLPWPSFEGRKASIYASARVLLNACSNAGSNQTELLRLFERLELWTAAEIPILASKSFGAGEDRYLPRLIEVFDGATPEDKRAVVSRARQQKPRALASYALAYRTGLLEESDIAWLLRLFVLPRPASSINMAESANPRAPEVLARDRRRVADLEEAVLRDLRARWRAGDPVIKGALETVSQERRSWGRGWSPEAKDAFLGRLCAGDL